MNKPVKYLIVSLVLFFTLLSAEGSFACGTVKGWVDIYFSDGHDNQDKALYKINCKPVIENNYKATPSEQEALAKMIRKGLKSLDYCDRSLAIKNYFLFDQLFWLQGSEVYDEIIAGIKDRINRPVHEIKGELSLYEGEIREDYCAQVNYEIKGMQWNGESICLTSDCKEIEMGSFKEKLGRIASFVNETGKCLPDTSEITLADRIVQIKSKRLNMRKAPDPQAAAIATLKRDDLLMVKSEKNGWLQVVNKRCKEGWVGGYLTKDARSR